MCIALFIWFKFLGFRRLYVIYYWPAYTQCKRGRLVTVAGICRRRRLSGSVTLHGGPAGGFTCAGQVMTSSGLQCNYSSTAARRASRVRATPCFITVSVLPWRNKSMMMIYLILHMAWY